MIVTWKKFRDNAVSVAVVLSYATLCVASCVFEPVLRIFLLSLRWVLPTSRGRDWPDAKLKKTEKDVFTALESLCGLSKSAQIERRALETRVLQELNSAVHLDTSARRNNYTLLQFAVGADSERVVHALLRRNANIIMECEASECSLPLFLTVRNRNLHIFEALLKAGASLSAPCVCMCFPDASACKFAVTNRSSRNHGTAHSQSSSYEVRRLTESLRAKQARASAQLLRTATQLGAAFGRATRSLLRRGGDWPLALSCELVAANYVEFLEVLYAERRVAEQCSVAALSNMLRCAAVNGSFDCFRFLLRTRMRADCCAATTGKICAAEQLCNVLIDCYSVPPSGVARSGAAWRSGLSIVHVLMANERCDVSWLRETVAALESCRLRHGIQSTATVLFASGTTRHETVFHLLADRLQTDPVAALNVLQFVVELFNGSDADKAARRAVLNRFDAVGQTALHRVLLSVNRDREIDCTVYRQTVQRFLDMLLANGADVRLGEQPLNSSASMLETLRFADGAASPRSSTVSCVHILLRGSLRALPTDISLPDALSTDRDLLLSSTEYLADFDALADALTSLLRAEAEADNDFTQNSTSSKAEARLSSSLANATVNGQSPLHVLLGSLRKCGPRALATQFGEPFERCVRVLIEHHARLDFTLPNKQGTCVSLVSAVGEAFVLEYDGDTTVGDANSGFIDTLLRTLLHGGMPANVCSDKRAVFLNGGVGNALIEFVRCAQFARSVHSLRAVRDWLCTLLTHGADPDREAYRCEPMFVHSQSNMFIREQRTFAVSHLLHFVPLLLTLPEPHAPNAIDDALGAGPGSASHARLARDAPFARCVCELLNLFAFTMQPTVFACEMGKLRNRLVNDVRRLSGCGFKPDGLLPFPPLDNERRSASICFSAELCIKQHLLRLFTQPLTLKQLCRLTLVRALDRRPAERVNQLPLPESIKRYLCILYQE